MNLFICNKLFDVSKLTYRQLGFGEQLFAQTVLKFELRLTLAEFKNTVVDSFNKFVVETKEDDEKTNAAESIKILVEYNYPDFNRLLEINRSGLGEFIQEYLFFELLESCLGHHQIEACSLAVNFINSICIQEAEVIILGDAYPINSYTPEQILRELFE